MLAPREHISKYANAKEADTHSEELRIQTRHFEVAMKKVRPLSTQELSMYKRISEQFGKPQISTRGRDRNEPDIASSAIS